MQNKIIIGLLLIILLSEILNFMQKPTTTIIYKHREGQMELPVSKPSEEFYEGQIRFRLSFGNPFDTLFIKIREIKQGWCRYSYLDKDTKETFRVIHEEEISDVASFYNEAY